MSPSDIDTFAEKVVSSPRGTDDLAGQISGFEKRFGYSTEDMRRRVASGELAETNTLCDWMILADLRDQLASQ